MREILVSIDVFAAIWAIRRPGEQTENDVLARLLAEYLLVDDRQGHSLKASSGVRPVEGHALHLEEVTIGKKEEKSSKSGTSLDTSVGEAGMGKVRWVDDVYKVVCELGGRASLHQIYKHVAAQRRAAGRSVPQSLEATIRRTIEDHSSDSANFRGMDLFTNVGRGEWAVRER